MNLLFVTSSPPEVCPFLTNEKRPPLGLGSLMSIARRQGHNVFFIDNCLKPIPFIKNGYLQKNHIDFVGIYANTVCYRDSLRMFKEIQNLRERGVWKGKIIVGGPHTSLAPESIPDFVDYIVQGEGEKALLKIVNGEAKSRILKEKRISDLDSLPFQPYDIFTKLPYHNFCEWMDTKPVFTMNTSRGCSFDCAFCSIGSIWGKQYTAFGADRIISEIEFLIKNYGAKGVYFREDNFTLNQQRVTEFCDKISKKAKIKWACETRVDAICDEKLVKLMSNAGCEAMFLGVESGSQRLLDILNKNITIEQIEEAITLCKKYKIKTYCSLLTGAPNETYEDHLMTKKLMEKLKPYEYAFNVFVGVPYSKLYEEILKNGAYEYKDDLGFLYLPGFDVKTKYFYGTDSKRFVDYDFKQRTDFDKKLLMDSNRQQPMHMRLFYYLLSFFPTPIAYDLTKFLKRINNRIIT